MSREAGSRNIEDVYPLSPIQQGMLFHSLYAPGSGVYISGLSCRLKRLRPEPFKRAWQAMVDRHAILRTAFVWKNTQKILQVVGRRVGVPMTWEDWRDLPAEVQQERWDALVAAEGRRDFDFSKAPLMRLTLARCAEDELLFLWNVHHILLDGWCISQILSEVFILYGAFCAGREPVLDPPPPYRAYIEWLQRQDLSAAEAFWRRALGGAPAATVLPTGAAGAAEAEAAVGSRKESLRLPESWTAAAEAFTRSHRLTMNTLSLGAWALLLARYSGDSDLVFGTVVSGRPPDLPGVEAMIGPFVNSLPLRVRLERRAAVLPWLHGIQALQVEMRQFEHTPLSEIQRWIGAPAGQPLFESVLAFENYPYDPASGGADVSAEDIAMSEQSSFPVSVSLKVRGGRLGVEIRCGAGRFEPVAGVRMLHHLVVLLAELAADPERPLEAVPILAPGERQQIEREWSTAVSTSPRRAVHELFSACAAGDPGAAALSFDGREMTYGQLDRRSNQVARFLRGLGCGLETPVGLCLPPSAEMVVGLLGILKVGGTYVPLDVSYPAERLAFMVEDAGIGLVLAGESLLPRLPDGVRTVDLERAWNEIARLSEEPLASPADDVPAGCLAYITYTSGSTGRPKGIGIPHGAVCRLVLGSDYLPFAPGERVGQASNLSFDAATFEIWGALLNGGTLVGIGRETALSPPALAARLREDGVTALFLTTALFHQVVREAPSAFAPLRHLLFGGEAVDPSRVREALEQPPGRLLHVYGPTESTTFATWFHVGDVPAGAATVPIGRPLAGTSAHVLDGAGRTVPVGVTGELFLGGDGLARGYAGQPAATAGSFVPDPFGRAPGGRLYRTGDLVRRRGDGCLEFIGRIDDQVKVRGFRIEPGEIEGALAAAPGVAACAVVARQEGPGERRLAAYVVPAAGEALDVSVLREFLGRRLPEFMVPAVFVFLEALPLTPNGKVDRRALPAPGGSRPALAQELVAPRTEIEERLAAIWAEVLKVERVGVHDNFFELGGDSILSIQIVARAYRAGLALSPRQVFEHQTVAELARVAGQGELVQGEQEVVTGAVPLTPIQRWFFARELPERHHFNQSLLLEVGEPLPARALAEALAAVTAHHDALRLRFVRGEEGWQAFNAGLPDPASATWIDLAGLRSAEKSRIIEQTAGELQRSLDLEHGPLVRAAFFACGAEEPGRLLLIAHHLVVDGVSWRVLLEDLETAWRLSARGEGITLPAKTTSFRRWAERLAEHARSGALAGELERWLEILSRPLRPLPVDHPGGGNRIAATRAVIVVLEESVTRALLQEVPPVYRTEINDVLLTALARGFSRWTGERSLRVDLEGHGREELFPDVDLSRTAGWFTAVFPVLLDLGGEADPGTELKRIKEQLRQIPQRGVGYGLLRYLAAGAAEEEAAGRLAAHPGPEVVFNYLGQLDQALAGGSSLRAARETAGAAVSPLGERGHLLEVNGSISGGRLRMVWSYSSELYERSTVEALAAGYLEEIRALVAHCQSPEAGGTTPSDFPLARLEQAALDDLTSGDRGDRSVEDIYPLTPLQQGLLFHALATPEAGTYVTQMVCEVAGALDLAAFRQAWQEMVDRHPVLRTGFAWRRLDRPLQVVHRSAAVPLTHLDWTGVAEEEIRARLDSYLADDLRRGFEMGWPPLIRLALLQVGEGSHLCVWSSHHILFDGWCLSVLFRDVLTCYEAFRAGRRLDLPRTAPYREYIAWLQAQDLSRAEAFWRSQLADLAAPSPVLAGEGAGRGVGDGERQTLVSAAATARLQALARRHRLTLNTLVQGAWALWLSRYSGQDDVVFGATVAGRPAGLPGVESMVGLFINTLPVRLRTPLTKPLLPWLAALQEQQVELRQYEHTPLADVRRWSGLPAGQALFETLLVFENYPTDPSVRQEAVSLEIRNLRMLERANYPLTLAAVPGERLLLRMTYDRSRFDEPAAHRMLLHLEGLLAEIAESPERALGEIPLLSAAERHALEVEWSDTAVTLPTPAVPELFSAQAARTPDAPAVACGGRSLSYGELERRADRLAHRLVELGVKAGSRVALCLERSVEAVVALLAVWKAGGASVPLDPSWPSERLKMLLEDSDPAVLVSEEAVAERLPAGAVRRLLLLDAGAEAIALQPEFVPEIGPRDGQLAYLIYTSGTTGRPKAVQVEHGNLRGILLGCLERFGGGDWGSMLHLASFSFDIALFELFMPLLSGGCAMLLRREEILDGRSLAASVGKVKALHAVPSLMRELLAAGGGKGVWPDVARVFLGGDTVPADLLAAVRKAFPGAAVTVLYGPTEGTIVATRWRVPPETIERSLIGRALPNVRLRVVDRDLRTVPLGVAGELCLGGIGVTRGYLGREELTRERYVLLAGERFYRTGDLVRWRDDGNLEFLGRADTQVKVRGFRVELGEIEAALCACSGVREAVVLARPREPGGELRLVAYVVADGEPAPGAGELLESLRGRLPDPLVPPSLVFLPALPLTVHGKVDRRALADGQEMRPGPRGSATPGAVPGPGFDGIDRIDGFDGIIARVWQDVLGREAVGSEESFFTVGGDSLLLMRLCSRLEQAFGREIPVADLFRYPTIAGQARYLRQEDGAGRHLPRVDARVAARSGKRQGAPEAIAIVGMAGRFPGASTLETFWHNLREGVESISFFSPEELTAAGVDPALLANSSYVRAKGVLEDIRGFDAPFFGLTANEATVMDPQHRLFLECAWEALEDAAVDPGRFAGRISVFAGSGPSSYLFHQILGDEALVQAVGRLQVTLLNDRDFLATQTAYRLGLRGLCATVQSACSTSLVAVHLACQGLLAGECDAALAGGVSISIPHTAGYLYQEGGVFSPDGHCRAFDAAAQGSLSGSGCGVVVLRRLSDALADGDPIHAVIRATAAANDGAARAGFTAPGVDGQMEVIAESLGIAGVEPETIGYVEAHGSGTPLGDPIEMAALTGAYRTRTDKTGFCPIGSVKTNIGHLDTAAGIAGLIKTALAVEHGVVPPSLHFARPNPQIDFAASPFYISTQAAPWPQHSTPRRAGVSSFGLGGTNVHAVLEQAPEQEQSRGSGSPQLLTLSARSAAALDAATARLREAFERSPDIDLAAAAATLQTGRKAFRHRRAVLCLSRQDTLEKLGPGNARDVSSGSLTGAERPLTFLFPGLGDHHPGMARELYASEAVVRSEIDRCAEILQPHLGLDLRRLLCAEDPPGSLPGRPLLGRRSPAPAGELGELGRTAIAQPAVFVVEVALARLLMSWGLRPQAMIGYSVGEYVAACLAGVMTLEEALLLVARRAQLIDSLPAGAMLAVPLAEEDLAPRLGGRSGAGLSLAALDGPHLSVVAGPREEVEELERRLGEDRVVCLWLDTAHAFHSAMIEPAVPALRDLASQVALRPPAIPFLSNVTGTWITAEQATDPAYWARQMRQTVRFGAGLEELLREPGRLLVEVGPGSSLSVLVRQHPLATASHLVVPAMCRPGEGSARAHLLGALGRLWTAGAQVDWQRLHQGSQAGSPPRRLRLPTYPFERQSYWAGGKAKARDARPPETASRPAERGARKSLREWLWFPTWRETRAETVAESGAALAAGGRWLLFLDRQGLGRRIAGRLAAAGQTVVTVAAGDTFADLGGGSYVLDPRRREDYDRLLASLRAERAVPRRVIHLWNVAPLEEEGTSVSSFERWQDLGLHSLLFFFQALLGAAEAAEAGEPGEGEETLRVGVVATHLQAVLDGEPLTPGKATLLGACRVIPLEAPGIRCASLDVPLAAPGSLQEGRLAEHLVAEMLRDTPAEEIAFRGRQRWVRGYEPLAGAPPAAGIGSLLQAGSLRRGGAYLITGGSQALGLACAEYLAESWAARLVLIADPELPARTGWEGWLAAHPAEDPVSGAIRRLTALEGAGADLTVLAADVSDLADEAQLRRALAAARERCGALDGIIHAATSATNGMIQLRTPEALSGVRGAHARGALLLAALAREAPTDLIVLCSSLTAVLGGVGQVDLCASGAFLSALAQAESQRGASVVMAIDWGPLQGAGPGGFGIQALDDQMEKNLEAFGISPAEAGEAMGRILAAPVPRVAVSVRDLPFEIQQARQLTATRVLADMAKAQTAGRSHGRPDLSTTWVAPRNDVEEALEGIWRQLFGIDRVGILDNFFELSGHSLLAIQMVSRIRERFQLDLPVTVVFEAPTIEALAARVLQARLDLLAPEDLSDAALLLAEIKNLTPDEVRRRLNG